jgi:hypothetical protein
MLSDKRWGCPYCKQTSSRRWNLKVHIDRAHGTGEPVERGKSASEDTYGSPRSFNPNANNDSFNPRVTETNSPSSTRASTKSRYIWPFSDKIDQCHQMALEAEENRNKINKIREVFGDISFSDIPRINAESLNFYSEITSEPPVPSVGISFQKKYGIPPSVESDTVKDSNVRGITESNKTTQEKPKKPTFDEYRKIKPEVTFDEYRGLCRDPVTDWEPVPSGNMLVKRNAFGEIVDFLILRKCGLYM